MRELIVNELTQAWEEIAKGFAHLLPRLIVMIIVAFVGWLIAKLLQTIVRTILRWGKFDKLSESAGATHFLHQAALPSSSELLSRFVFWVAWVGFILMGVDALGIVGLQEYVAKFFFLLPRLLVALVILFVGLAAASFFSRAALLAAVNANLRSARVVGQSVRSLLIMLTLAMAFEELGVAGATILTAFGVLFGALMLGLAIAFGLGGKDLAREFLERRFGPATREKEEKEDELSPL